MQRAAPFALLSLLVLIPCFWLPRIYSVDLPSHAYNAWLTLLTERGEAPGLHVVPVWTNFVFDVMLVETMRAFGVDWAQRLSVSACVLFFFWAAFAWLRVSSGQAVWHTVPLLLLITHGWVFQAGFFNFYLGVAFGLCAATAFLRGGRAGAASGVACLAAAAACNLISLACVAPLIAVQVALRVVPERRRVLVSGGALVAIAVATAVAPHIVKVIPHRESGFVLGMDQLSHSGFGTVLISSAYAATAMLFLILLLLDNSPRKVLLDARIQLLVVASVAIFAVPWGVDLPQYTMPISLLRERSSVLVILCFALAWSSFRPPRPLVVIMSVLCVASFAVVYTENVRYFRLEEQVRAAVETLPARTRVWSNAGAIDMRTPLGLHIVERACIGHCFNLNNYEIFSKAFRLQATKSPLAVTDPKTFAEIDTDGYKIQPRDLPLVVVHNNTDPCAPVVASPMTAGDTIPRLMSASRTSELVGRAPACAK